MFSYYYNYINIQLQQQQIVEYVHYKNRSLNKRKEARFIHGELSPKFICGVFNAIAHEFN